MNSRPAPASVASCLCGQVRFEAAGPPILAAACYCASCQAAGRRFEALAGAPAVLEPDGGTAYLLYRKDRVRCAEGAEQLQAHRLTPGAPTRRLLASCCNTPMALDFTKGHWLTMYRDRFGSGAPAVEMRVMTAERPQGPPLAGDVPSYPGRSGRFMWKLLAAWAAMGFRRPPAVPPEAREGAG